MTSPAWKWAFAAVTMAACVAGSGYAAEPSHLPGTSSELTLDDAIAAALRHSPALSAHRSAAAAGDARIVDAEQWPNPQVQLDVENVGGTDDYGGTKLAETTLWLTQPIQLGGDRAEQRRVAVFDRLRLDRQREARRLELVTEVRKRFVAVLLAQARSELASEILSLSSEAVRTVEKRVAAGAASLAERAQVRLALGRSQMEVQRAQREARRARRQLAILWGSSEPEFRAVAGNMEDVPALPAIDSLLQALDRSPAVTRWDAEIERRAAAVGVERARRIPDFNVTAGGRHFSDNDDVALVFSLWFQLPVFNTNHAAITEAQHLIDKARAERDAAHLEARTALLAGYDDLQMQSERITLLRDHMLADARTASREALTAYRRGAVHALDVLAVQRVVFDLHDEYLQSLADYQTSLIEVERLAATSPSEEVAP